MHQYLLYKGFQIHIGDVPIDNYNNRQHIRLKKQHTILNNNLLCMNLRICKVLSTSYE